MGVKKNKIIALPTPGVSRNRTYAAGIEVKRWLTEHPDIKRINLLTLGAHARRSHYLYSKVLPLNTELGIIAVAPKDYNPKRWWMYSEGIKSVVFESIACLYVLIF